MKNLIYIFIFAVIATSCNSTNNSVNVKAEANKAKMQRFYDEVINAHNPAMLDSFCTADFIDHNPDQGFTGKGLEDARASFTSFFTAFPDIHITTNFMVADGDKVVAHVSVKGTNSGAMGPMPATNKEMNVEGMDCVSIIDGKATERWGFFDSMKMMEQLGMMPEPGAMPDSTKKMDAKK